jgi:hypothetical protein
MPTVLPPTDLPLSGIGPLPDQADPPSMRRSEAREPHGGATGVIDSDSGIGGT